MLSQYLCILLANGACIGGEYLTEYTFNTKVAKHMFCKKCGVQAFYTPRSNPDGIAITLACVRREQVSCIPPSHIRIKLSSS
jgi:hypothetical protein